jgi:hypothetical protein
MPLGTPTWTPRDQRADSWRSDSRGRFYIYHQAVLGRLSRELQRAGTLLYALLPSLIDPITGVGMNETRSVGLRDASSEA